MLAALAVVSLNNARARARDARRVSDIKQIQTALELYYLDQNDYPTGTGVVIGGKCLDKNGFSDTCTDPVYMAVVPNNPAPHDDGTCTDLDYLYTRNSTTSYSLGYCVGADIGQIEAGPHTATPAGIVED
jgi:type II secretory pathway pseudopilin PulG